LAENQNIIRKVISDSGVEGKVWRMTASGLWDWSTEVCHVFVLDGKRRVKG
jgi:hypothetical protein